ncbi:trypsin-like serine peptidase [Kitasatospora kifunensis]|uniref:V8-like Glu-specific endopeptidase n=1 Tax=Kitasatospora kifunensis TaxID=58351 RepID=A0A7W7VUX7_KITKI|nr:trypsin-like serine protease [Kitasatospora kifunensis]MBB4923099.1 V8-like Glu-specific endopeptidase [Kitasatospora kifunensis]
MTAHRVALGLAAALVISVTTAGCGSPAGRPGRALFLTPSSSASSSPSTHRHGWNKQRFLAAFDKHKDITKTASPTAVNALVGAVFTNDASGDHFCTASVVDSAGQNLIVTAAHCVYDPGVGQRADLVFVPGYRGGEAPNGVWPLAAITVDQRWAQDGDPDLDVAFAVVQPQGGKQVQQVLGANKLGVGKGYQLPVRMTGYPSTADVPITCMNTTTEQSATQLKIACPDYTGGTSGSPWVTGFDPQTKTGTVVGVIGGYQEGGNTPDISYSSYFGDAVQSLYDRATG